MRVSRCPEKQETKVNRDITKQGCTVHHFVCVCVFACVIVCIKMSDEHVRDVSGAMLMIKKKRRDRFIYSAQANDGAFDTKQKMGCMCFLPKESE